MSLIEYMEYCYSVLVNGKPPNTNIITINLCCAHTIKNIVYDVHTCFGKKSFEGRLLIEVIIALVDLDDYHQKKLIFLHLAVLLKNK